MTAIPSGHIPKTYHDAITVAQELGIPFLWIDSLCIVQDDTDDWEREALRMTSVYENAVVTLSAAWGTNSDAGCFHKYHPPLIIEVKQQDDSESNGKDAIRRLYFRPHPDLARYVSNAPLNRRAWTLQEVILSRRTIIFAEDQLYWLCSSLFDSEDRLQDGLRFSDNLFEPALHLPTLGLYTRQPDRPSYELYDSWHTTVQNYSARSLTFSKDKLAALAGVTQMFAKVTKDIPILGLWKSDICRDLLWQVPPGIHGRLDSEAIRVLNLPSWSWIKLAGIVETRDNIPPSCAPKVRGDEDPDTGLPVSHVEISSMPLSWTGTPLTSQILTASINGHGKVARIVDVEKTRSDEQCICKVHSFTFDVLSSVSRAVYKCSSAAWYLDECTSERNADLRLLIFYVQNLRKSDEIVCLWGMVVTPVQNSNSTARYRRIGFATCYEFARHAFDACPDIDFILI